MYCTFCLHWFGPFNINTTIQQRNHMRITAFHHFTRRLLRRLPPLLIAIIVCQAAPIDEIYEYDDLNRLTKAGADTYQHDAAGNLTQTTAVVTPSLFPTPTSLTLGFAIGSTGNVNLTANLAWTALSSQPAWLTVSPATGSTSATLTLTATSANHTTSTRSSRTVQVKIWKDL